MGFSFRLRYYVDVDRRPYGGRERRKTHVQQIRRNAQAVSARAQGRHLHGDALLTDKLDDHLKEIGDTAQEMFDRLVAQMKEAEGVTEQLKAENQMEWVGRMNSIRSRAEEVVLSELVYC